MGPKFYILHDIPGRIRLQILALRDKTSHAEIEGMFSSLNGIRLVRIEPVINTMLVEYDDGHLSRNSLLRYISLFFQQTRFDPFDSLMVNLKPRLRSELFRSLVSGLLLFAAYMRKATVKRPDAFEYIAVIATGYTVLSHGTNKLNHPDVLTGIISLVSLGTGNMLHISTITWAINIIEILYDIYKSNRLNYAMY
ncbi:HMA2 domain-containing protein [Bacillus sp. OK048]|uniref:HMA2 domain-containing protein n=1 Tax=Bacillus sp. OK048 TaxID=1882761 RepID=UPI000883408C|nr:hypothetical protein [Bacillus sp. OK048]SDN51446.1 hypothetical protein SAMN05443253_11330 [Bacillus sp. OK048]